MSCLDNLLVHTLAQQRALTCDLVMLTEGTDLRGAFDTCMLDGFDKSIKKANARPKIRNLFRMVYLHVMIMVRVRSANGETATSHPYHPTQGCVNP